MTNIKNAFVELISSNLDTFRPYKSQFSEQQLDDFNKLELAHDILSGKSSDCAVVTKTEINNCMLLKHISQ